MREVHQVTAPVDGGLHRLEGPLMHPDAPYAVWREYDRPAPGPWGSYLDVSPLPRHPDRRGPIACAVDTLVAHRAGVRA